MPFLIFLMPFLAAFLTCSSLQQRLGTFAPAPRMTSFNFWTRGTLPSWTCMQILQVSQKGQPRLRIQGGNQRTHGRQYQGGHVVEKQVSSTTTKQVRQGTHLP